MKYPAFTLGLLLATTCAHAAPTAFQANYAVSVDGITLGNMDSSLSYSGNGYTYQKLTKANGLAAMLSGDTLSERSNGTKQGDQLSTQQYANQHKNKRKDKRDEFRFTSATQVDGKYNDQAYQEIVPNNTIDPALMELRLMDDLAHGKALNYQVFNKGKLHTYTFQKLGKESIDTAQGKYECEKVQRSEEGGKRQTTVWLAPQLNYAIVKARHTDDGETIETVLQRYKAQ